MAKRRRGPLRRLFGWTWKLTLLFLLVTAGPTLLLRWVPPPTSAFMLLRAVEHREQKLYQIEYAWVDLVDISRDLQLAVIVAEDQRFPKHRGFDFKAIQKAIEESARGERTRGASTLTQQVAKNLFLWPGKSLVRKGIEAWFTVLIETFWTKQRILEVYLNIAEFGPGIFGAKAASATYFDKAPAELTPEEAALMAAALPNPRRLRVWNPGPYAQERTQEILGLMEKFRGYGWLYKVRHAD